MCFLSINKFRKRRNKKIIYLLTPFIKPEDYSKDIILFSYKRLISNDKLLNMAKNNNRIDFL